MLGYQIAVFIHIIASITWLGGMLFLVMVMVPLTRREIDSPAEAARLLGQVGRKFRPVAWASIVLLVATGLYIATDQWRVSASDFFNGETYFLKVLQAKVGVVLIVIGLSIIHDFILGPRVTRQLEALRQGGAPSATLRKSRRMLLILARVNMLLVLVILGLAVTLTRGSVF